MAKTLEDAGFSAWAGCGAGGTVYRKVVDGVEIMATVHPGQVVAGPTSGPYPRPSFSYATVEEAAADLASRYGTGNDEPGAEVGGRGLREVSWDEFQALRAGGDES
jgi:hypothetical protein